MNRSTAFQMMPAAVLTVLIITLFTAVLNNERGPRTRTWIETERGLLRWEAGRCRLGMLTSRDGINLVNEEGVPITCSGYVELTDVQAAEWGK